MDRLLLQFEDVAAVATATPGAAAWTARDPLLGRTVLIKRLPDAHARTRATQALALAHPHIVPTRRWLRDENRFYVVRDYEAGRNLRQTLADTALRAFDRLQAFLSPVLDALDYAHRAGMAHGHVTPENVVIGAEGARLCDFATVALGPESPTPRADFFALCALYKEFLPERSREDEAGSAARERLLRNLTEVQQTASSADELRYKLDAVAKMAALLGFGSEVGDREQASGRARLVCAVSPATATLNPGGGAVVTLSVRNEGDLPLHVETVGSDVVWLNYHSRFVPFDLSPDTGRDLLFTLSGARLASGTYQSNLVVRSNSGMTTVRPAAGTPWHEQTVALPVIVSGQAAPKEDAPPPPVPLADRLPPATASVTTPKPPSAADEQTGIAVTQEPDPGLVRYGQNGVVHLGIQNIGPQRMRLDKVSTWPPWLTYPGDFQALWIEPGATQYLGFSIIAASLTGGDYKAEVTFITSTLTETLLGPQPVWRELRCEVRVRVVRGVDTIRPGGTPGAGGLGCAPMLLALASSLGLLGLALVRVFTAVH